MFFDYDGYEQDHKGYHGDFFPCDLMSGSSCPFLIAKVSRCLEVLWLL